MLYGHLWTFLNNVDKFLKWFEKHEELFPIKVIEEDGTILESNKFEGQKGIEYNNIIIQNTERRDMFSKNHPQDSVTEVFLNY